MVRLKTKMRNTVLSQLLDSLEADSVQGVLFYEVIVSCASSIPVIPNGNNAQCQQYHPISTPRTCASLLLCSISPAGGAGGVYCTTGGSGMLRTAVLVPSGGGVAFESVSAGTSQCSLETHWLARGVGFSPGSPRGQSRSTMRRRAQGFAWFHVGVLMLGMLGMWDVSGVVSVSQMIAQL